MKKYCIYFMVFVLSLNAPCEIKNGYEKDISSARRSLQRLNELLSTNKEIAPSQRRNIKTKIDVLVNLIACYELTANLLTQFKIISPDLYSQIDTITDRQRRRTDVYVKLIPREQALIQAAGLTQIDQVVGDNDAYFSEYGERTVSVRIWITTKAIFVLAHELGHVKYLVPNLASYVVYHREEYGSEFSGSNYIGHEPGDLSGREAEISERKFKADYSNYWDAMRDHNKNIKYTISLNQDRKRVIE